VTRSRRVAGVILAGGQSRRMGGGDKCLADLGGRSLLARVIARLEAQTGLIAINANGDPVRFARFGLPILADSVAGQPGPLAGILAGLDWAAGQGIGRIVTVAADTPFFPADLAGQLLDLADAAPIVLAETGGRVHPVFGLWPVGLREGLRADLAAGARRVGAWAEARGCVHARFPAPGGLDPFFNINTPEDLAAARAHLSS
jgi:molybdenum cofactor guanylyltransferase